MRLVRLELAVEKLHVRVHHQIRGKIVLTANTLQFIIPDAECNGAACKNLVSASYQHRMSGHTKVHQLEKQKAGDI